jgi:hypothetical protein
LYRGVLAQPPPGHDHALTAALLGLAWAACVGLPATARENAPVFTGPAEALDQRLAGRAASCRLTGRTIRAALAAVGYAA